MEGACGDPQMPGNRFAGCLMMRAGLFLSAAAETDDSVDVNVG